MSDIHKLQSKFESEFANRYSHTVPVKGNYLGGLEIPDQTPIEVPSDGFEKVSSMDLKMQIIIEEMFKRFQKDEPDETVEDDLDFELESDQPENKYTNYATKEDFVAAQKEVARVEKLEKERKAEAAKKAAAEARRGRKKPAEPGNVELDEDNFADDES